MNKMVYILSVVFISAVFSFFANAQHMSVGGKGDDPGVGQSTEHKAATKSATLFGTRRSIMSKLYFSPVKIRRRCLLGLKSRAIRPSKMASSQRSRHMLRTGLLGCARFPCSTANTAS